MNKKRLILVLFISNLFLVGCTKPILLMNNNQNINMNNDLNSNTNININTKTINNKETKINYEKNNWEIKYEVTAPRGLYGVKYNDLDKKEIWVSNPKSNWSVTFKIFDNNFPIHLYGQGVSCDGPCPEYSNPTTAKIYVDDILIITSTGEQKSLIEKKFNDL